MKKLCAILMALIMLLALIPVGAIPVAAATSGTTGDCTWTLDGTHLTISGNGAMGKYDWTGPWGDSITSVTIEDSVTSIGDGAFRDCWNLQSITIPDSVTSIGAYAFYSCWNLTSITIPDSVTTIGNSAFSLCEFLKSITIPDSVTTIGEHAFAYCGLSTSVTIPDSVTAIGMGAFVCSLLPSIIVEENNPQYSSLDGVLFNKDQSTLVQYPNGKSGTYTFPDSVTAIGDYAFSHCYSFESMTIPDSVTSIGDGAFAGSSLTGITIPDSVTSIDNYAFSGCELLTSVILCDSVTTIGDYAFSDCISLEEMIIPNSVIAIGDYAFASCDSLSSVTIPDRVTTIGDRAFYRCYSLTSVTIPCSVFTIGRMAFYRCDSLTDVHYNGTEENKANMSVGRSNEPLLNATWHYYDNVCDVTCNICDAVREVSNHVYSYVCDTNCDICGVVREAEAHIYFDACDTDCNVCGAQREVIHDYDGCLDDTCDACGWHRDALSHTYDDEYDTDCNVCGAIREVTFVPVTFGGNSVSEEVSGLAFKFTVDAIGMTTIQNTTAVYDNATVSGQKLLSMGAIVSNAVESVDISAVYLFDWSDTDVTYAVRLIEIPTDHYDTTITATPYIVLEIDGVATTLYGAAQTASMNEAAK